MTLKIRHSAIIGYGRRMAYGDDFAPPMQRRLASTAMILGMFEMTYVWLVAGFMAAFEIPRLMAIYILLSTIIVGNGVIMFGRARAASHWLRVCSLVSILLVIGGPTVLVLYAIADSAS